MFYSDLDAKLLKLALGVVCIACSVPLLLVLWCVATNDCGCIK